MLNADIQRKIESLIRLAERPGTPEEGKLACQYAIRLSLKYGLKCKFVVNKKSTRPTASTPPPKRAHEPQSPDMIFYRWIRGLANLGWLIYDTTDTKIGKQIKFRKINHNSEIRITQRHKSDEFEAEHVMRPDLDIHGYDRSYTTFMTINLGELLRHLTPA